jgi:glycosyltransferase involved in cell wall biosynthesis
MLSNNYSATVAILMSTYNGEKYLERQIESILSQTYKKINLLIRDDGSNDNTILIINKYLKAYPECIFYLHDDFGNLGSTKSFFQLLSNVKEYSYYMFADQDDIWFENKVDIFIDRITKCELLYGKPNAIMIFGNMSVVDHNLSIIDHNFWHFQKLNPELIFNWKKVLSQNVVTGCSMIINLSAINILRNVPNIKMIHDHFIAIKIAKYGIVDFIHEPTMFYVQHVSNVVGASSFNFKFIKNRISVLIKTWGTYFKLCKYFDMNILCFIYFKFTINTQRLLK